MRLGDPPAAAQAGEPSTAETIGRLVGSFYGAVGQGLGSTRCSSWSGGRSYLALNRVEVEEVSLGDSDGEAAARLEAVRERAANIEVELRDEAVRQALNDDFVFRDDHADGRT